MNDTDSLLVLWDIDGTLLSPAGAGKTDYEDALSAVYPEVQWGEVHTHGKTDRQITNEYLEGHGLSSAEAPLVLEQLDIISHKYLSGDGVIPPLAGVHGSFDRLSACGYVNGLLTGNTPARAINKLNGAGVDITKIDWSQSFLGANAPQRGSMTASARRRFPNRAIVVIGDTPLDGIAASAADIAFVGVTTGIYGAEALLEAGAALVIEDLVGGSDELDRGLRAVSNGVQSIR